MRFVNAYLFCRSRTGRKFGSGGTEWSFLGVKSFRWGLI
jgi:hypothetical protein